jgi:hypothetical protein
MDIGTPRVGGPVVIDDALLLDVETGETRSGVRCRPTLADAIVAGEV